MMKPSRPKTMNMTEMECTMLTLAGEHYKLKYPENFSAGIYEEDETIIKEFWKDYFSGKPIYKKTWKSK